MIDEKDKQIKQLEKEILNLQMMLGFVLKTTGPVEITDEMITAGLPSDSQIFFERLENKNVWKLELATE